MNLVKGNSITLKKKKKKKTNMRGVFIPIPKVPEKFLQTTTWTKSTKCLHHNDKKEWRK